MPASIPFISQGRTSLCCPQSQQQELFLFNPAKTLPVLAAHMEAVKLRALMAVPQPTPPCLPSHLFYLTEEQG